MLEEVVNDYAAYFKLDVSNGFQTVQDVIDNMLTRLEELTSILQIIKLKNNYCSSEITDRITNYRSEITTLSKKVTTLKQVIQKLQNQMDILEKQVEKAEKDFGISNSNKIRSFLKPLLFRNKSAFPEHTITLALPEKIYLESVLDNFEFSQ